MKTQDKARKVSLDAMWAHIESLAAQYGTTIDTRVDRPVDAYAVPWANTIRIPPLRSHIGYATALHELGHLHGPNQQCYALQRGLISRQEEITPISELESEASAWQWARDNTMVWTPAMERCAVQSLAQVAKKLTKELA
jgi:hypothetical protein